MSCLQQLNIIIRSSKYDITTIFQRLRWNIYPDSYYPGLRSSLHDLISALNANTECILSLKPYTTDLYEILSFILMEPDDTNSSKITYAKLGLSNEFISALMYKSGRPKADMRPYLQHHNLIPKYLPKQPFYISEGVTSNDVLINNEHPILPFPYTRVNHLTGDEYYISSMEVNVIYPNCIIPVIRYQEGMAGYFTTDYGTKTYCGTFYYYEPDAEYLLFAPYTLVATNKITACINLGMDINYITDLMVESKGDWIVGEDFDKDGYPNYMGFNVQGDTKREQWYNVVLGYSNGTIDAKIHRPDMYAGEDIFDQILCETANKLGIDCIILQYMTGATRTVTEVLDTRTRIESFRNIYFPPLL